jgi:hypothetical protein
LPAQPAREIFLWRRTPSEVCLKEARTLLSRGFRAPSTMKSTSPVVVGAKTIRAGSMARMSKLILRVTSGSRVLQHRTISGDRRFPSATRGDENRGFVAAFSPSLAKLCLAAYERGAEAEQLEGLALSSNGLALATGFSFSTKIPVGAVVDRGKQASAFNGRDVHTRILAVPANVLCR